MINKCKKIQEMMWLTIYDEISPEQREVLESHLKACPECQMDFEEIKKTAETLDKKVQFKPSTELLKESRKELHERLMILTQPKDRLNWLIKLWDIVSLNFTPAARFAAAVSILILGLFLGRFITEATSDSISDSDALKTDFYQSHMAGVESLQYDPETKQVALLFNTLETKSVNGDLNQPEIQHILAKTLITDERPNIRLKTVNALTNTKSFDEKILDALIHVIYQDENPGIRLKAIKLLKSIPINESLKSLLTKVFVRVLLKEKNSAIRIEAIDGLSKIEDDSITPIIYDAAKDDSSEYVRNKAATMLERLENPPIPK